jgi:hypothetical protein
VEFVVDKFCHDLALGGDAADLDLLDEAAMVFDFFGGA